MFKFKNLFILLFSLGFSGQSLAEGKCGYIVPYVNPMAANRSDEIKAKNVDVVGGHTQFKIDGHLVNIEPLKNRAVIFKSDILHRGLAPSRGIDDLRVSLAFKLCEI